MAIFCGAILVSFWKSIIPEIARISLNFNCRQAISFGETTTRGGDIALFHGVHVDNFSKSIGDTDIMTAGTHIPLAVITGVDPIDQFFRNLLIGMLKEGTDALTNEEFLEKLDETLIIIRDWLDKTDRKHADYGNFSVKVTDSLHKALEHLCNFCSSKKLLSDLELDNLQIILILIKEEELITDMERRRDRKDFLPVGKRLSVSERLEWYNERNQKQVEVVNAHIGVLSALSIPVLAIVYKALGDLESVGKPPFIHLYIIAVAIFFSVFALIHSLLTYTSSSDQGWWSKLLERRLPFLKDKTLQENQRDETDIFTIEAQSQYKETGEKYAKLLNDKAHEKERVDLSTLDYMEASDVLMKARLCCKRRLLAKFSALLHVISIVFYAIASVWYGILWLCSHSS